MALDIHLEFIRISSLTEKLNISEATIYRWQREGIMPKSVKLGPKTSAWRVADIEKWLEEKSSQSEGK